MDNLKLGYGGTKGEMARLINDAARLDSAVKANDLSFNNVVVAIHAMQVEMGIAGTTAKEAASTIEGSGAAAKAAWSNLVTGMANEDADLKQLTQNFLDSAVTYGKNLIPRVEEALNGIGAVVNELVPQIVSKIPEFIDNVLPKVLTSAGKIASNVVSGISANFPKIIETGVKMIQSFLDGVGRNTGKVVAGALKIGGELVRGLTQVLPKVVEVAGKIIIELAAGLLRNAPKIVMGIARIADSIVAGLIKAIFPAKSVGRNIILGLWEGITSLRDWIFNKISGIASGVVNAFKRVLGIHSPSRVMRVEVGHMMGEGMALGIEDEYSRVTKATEGLYRRGTPSASVSVETATASRPAAVGLGGVTININGAKYSDERSIAQAVAQELQAMLDRRDAVYA